MSISSISANPSLLTSLLNLGATNSTGATSSTGTTSATGSSKSSSSQAQTLQNFLDALTQALQQGTAVAATQGGSSATSAANALAAALHHHGHHLSQGSQLSGNGAQGSQSAWQATPAMGSTISVRA